MADLPLGGSAQAGHVDEHIDSTFDAGLTRLTLEHELQLVDEAVAAVASGHFTRVTVAGLRFGDELLPRTRALAEAQGLTVRPLFHNDEHGVDLMVERERAPETTG